MLNDVSSALSSAWSVREEDHQFFLSQIGSFLPHRVFDAHSHLYQVADFLGRVPEVVLSGPPVVDWDCYQDCMNELLPQRDFTSLAFPFPAASVNVGSANRFLIGEVARRPRCLGQMLVTPEMDPDFIRETVRTHRLVGLKCYHVFSRTKPTFESSIEDFLPEAQMRIAHEESLTMTIHLVRPRALADPVNQEIIRRLATRYPNSRWILAHAARGFNAHHTIEGIESLRGLRNVWCDTSAVTESGAFEAIVRTLGHERLLYGSDFPITHIRGRCVAIGDSFLWLTEENTKFHASHSPLRPVLVLLESLRVLKQAAWNLNLKDSQVERIFHGNAMELYGLSAE